MEDWYRRLKDTQNYRPEELGMTDLAHKDVGNAVERISELEQENADFREALEVIRDRDPIYCYLCKRRQEIAQQALKQ